LGGTGRFTLDKFVGVKKNGRNRVKTKKVDSCRGRRQYIIIIIMLIKKIKKWMIIERIVEREKQNCENKMITVSSYFSSTALSERD
jgi:hypothetical protein